MKKALSFCLFFLSLYQTALSQTVQPLQNQLLRDQGFDICLGISYNVISDSPRLSHSDEFGNSTWTSLRSSAYSIEVPVNYRIGGLLFATSSIGIKDLLLTPLSNETSNSMAESETHYPFDLSRGYSNSLWSEYRFSIGSELIKFGVSINHLLYASKKRNEENLLISLGKNSYSRFVPSIFVEYSLETTHFRLGLRGNFQFWYYLDGKKLFRTTGEEQRSFDTGPDFSLSFFVAYKLFESYGRYHSYYNSLGL